MSPRARMEYLETIYLRYKKAPVKEKTMILNEFCLNCGYHRKTIFAMEFTPNLPGASQTMHPTPLSQPFGCEHRSAHFPR